MFTDADNKKFLTRPTGKKVLEVCDRTIGISVSQFGNTFDISPLGIYILRVLNPNFDFFVCKNVLL